MLSDSNSSSRLIVKTNSGRPRAVIATETRIAALLQRPRGTRRNRVPSSAKLNLHGEVDDNCRVTLRCRDERDCSIPIEVTLKEVERRVRKYSSDTHLLFASGTEMAMSLSQRRSGFRSVSIIKVTQRIGRVRQQRASEIISHVLLFRRTLSRAWWR